MTEFLSALNDIQRIKCWLITTNTDSGWLIYKKKRLAGHILSNANG